MKLPKFQLATNEAEAIRTLTGRFPLRLHVVGDCTTDTTAQTVSRAASEHRAKFDQPVWTYTHAWRKVKRASWSDVSVLASCETIADTKQAMRKGYGAAIVVSEHKDTKAYSVDGVRLIPCPEQTGRAKNCETCKLCFNADRLRETNSVIAFAAHGATKKAKSVLVQIQGAL